MKAIACASQVPIRLADQNRFQQTVRTQIDYVNESLLKVGFEAFGTNMVSDMVDVRGGYPTHNRQADSFEQIEQVNAQALTDQVFVNRVRCFACPIACGRGTEIREGKWAGHRGEGPEYETVNAFGALC